MAFEANARGKFQADLAMLARRQLEDLGVNRIYGGGECTYARADRYFFASTRWGHGPASHARLARSVSKTVELAAFHPHFVNIPSAFSRVTYATGQADD